MKDETLFYKEYVKRITDQILEKHQHVLFDYGEHETCNIFALRFGLVIFEAFIEGQHYEKLMKDERYDAKIIKEAKLL